MSSKTNNNRSSEKVREKRKLTPDKNTTQQAGNTVKRNKKSDMSKKEMEEIQKFIADSLKGVSSQIAEVQSALDNKITEMASEVSGNVKEEINTLKDSMDSFASNVTSQISLIETKLTTHDERLDNNEDDIERITLLNQLRIVGLPFSENENLIDFFIKLSNAIGYSMESPSSIPSLRRIPSRKNGIATGTNTILVYFIAQHYKDSFYSAYLRKLPLKPEMFGLPDQVRIIIGENLTKKNAALFNFCNALKKEGKLAQLYSSNGLIYAKFKRGKQEKAHIVRSKRDIEILCEQNAQLMSTLNNTSNATLDSSSTILNSTTTSVRSSQLLIDPTNRSNTIGNDLDNALSGNHLEKTMKANSSNG